MESSDNITLKTVIMDEPTVEQIRMIIELYKVQGWWKAGDENGHNLIPRLIAGSHCFVVALHGNNIVGMGRAISDGVSDAYIQDMTVGAGYRNRGIGRKILQTILEKLNSDGIRWIGLISEPGSCGLYRRAGFLQMPAWIPMLMNRNI